MDGRRGPDDISSASGRATVQATRSPSSSSGLTWGWATTWSSASTLSSSSSAPPPVDRISRSRQRRLARDFPARAGFGRIAPSLVVPYLLLGSEAGRSLSPTGRLSICGFCGPITSQQRQPLHSLTRFRDRCYTQRDFRGTHSSIRFPQNEGARLMADDENGEEKRKGGKGKLLALLALIGAGVAFLMFWRRRGGSEEEEEEEI